MALDPSDDALAAIADYEKETTMSEINDELTLACPECESGVTVISLGLNRTPQESPAPEEWYVAEANWTSECANGCRLPEPWTYAVSADLIDVLTDRAADEYVSRRQDAKANPRIGGR